eukprot:COSAG04_NODE_2397_length_4209_cov_10.504380_3_plen_199_part_00
MNACFLDVRWPYCYDRASSSDWLFGLEPGPPQRFEPTGTDTDYQTVNAGSWPAWGGSADLNIGWDSGAPGPGSDVHCHQGGTYHGTDGEICGGDGNWGATDVEVWYQYPLAPPPPPPTFPGSRLLTPEWDAALSGWIDGDSTEWALCCSTFEGCSNGGWFHENCDAHTPTLTVVHNSLDFTFGGFVRILLPRRFVALS